MHLDGVVYFGDKSSCRKIPLRPFSKMLVKALSSAFCTLLFIHPWSVVTMAMGVVLGYTNKISDKNND